MIGRGTRLCPNLFGPGEDKKDFVIFDFCENFEFFDVNPDGANTKRAKPLLQQIFENKLIVVKLISESHEKTEEESEIRDVYVNQLHKIVSNLDETRFMVRKQNRYVQEFKNKDQWLNLTDDKINRINKHLSYLQPLKKDDDEMARRFDLIILNYQILLLTGSDKKSKYQTKIFNTAGALQRLDNIPQVYAHIDLIKTVQTEKYWKGINVKSLEELRVALRDLIRYLDTKSQEPVYTKFEDEIQWDKIVKMKTVFPYYENLQSYKDRVESYIRKNKNHLVIHKLRTNIPITEDELNTLENLIFTDDVAKTKEDFVKQYGDKPLGEFIRSIIGLDKDALNEAFSEFLQAGQLTADQITFINTIIN